MKVIDIDIVKYEKAMQIMENLMQEVKEKNENILLFCRHFPNLYDR